MQACTLLLFLVMMTSSVGASEAEVTFDELVVATTMSKNRVAAAKTAVKAFYTFWNTGDTQWLNQALSSHFVDQTLPKGRPQGPEGPAFASRQFRAAVPDLTVQVKKVIVAGDMVTVHMEFRGHFTGVFGSTRGAGQSIDFIATDLLKLSEGKISDNWHIEDNLTLLSQMGVAQVQP